MPWGHSALNTGPDSFQLLLQVMRQICLLYSFPQVTVSSRARIFEYVQGSGKLVGNVVFALELKSLTTSRLRLTLRLGLFPSPHLHAEWKLRTSRLIFSLWIGTVGAVSLPLRSSGFKTSSPAFAEQSWQRNLLSIFEISFWLAGLVLRFELRRNSVRSICELVQGIAMFVALWIE